MEHRHTLTFQLEADGNPQEREREVHAAFAQLCEHFPEWRSITMVDAKASAIPDEAINNAVGAARTGGTGGTGNLE